MSFNPLSDTVDWPLRKSNLLYQSLFMFDSIRGEMVPSLAESYEQREGEIEIVIHAAARWSDGKPVTAADVKYSFDLARQYKGAPNATLWRYLSAVRIADAEAGEQPRTLIFELNRAVNNPLTVLDVLQDHRIVPRHVIEPLLAAAGNDLNEFLRLKLDNSPVVSGPYQLHSYGSEKIALVRRDDYWGNRALHGGKLSVPKYIIHPIYRSNDHYSVALQQGRLDASSAFMPRIWLKQRKGVRSWYDQAPYHIPTAIPSLVVNVTHKPLHDRHLRRAMAFAINYKDIRELAVSGYSEPLRPGLILPFGSESAYFSEVDAKTYGASVYDPERARATLTQAGYQALWDADGELIETRDRAGNKVPTLYVKCPTGWTDWETIVRIAVKSMRAVGIDARERFVDANLYWPALAGGDFDLIMKVSSPFPTPSKPWSRFEAMLSARDWAPEGEKMQVNEGRFNNPKGPDFIPRFEELLALIPSLTDEGRRKQAYRELNKLYMIHQPSIPVVYRPQSFYQFNTRVWKGFPTAKHPYLPPTIPGFGTGTGILWHLKPVDTRY